MLFLDPDSPPEFYKNFSQIFSAATRKSPGSEKQGPAFRSEAKSGAASASKPVSETRAGPGSGLTFSFKDKYELEHMEETILEAEARVSELSARVQDPEIMADPIQMANICRDLEKAEARVQALYTRWDELEQKKADAGK
jgi:ATP-binding cassette subfamily F protein uup